MKNFYFLLVGICYLSFAPVVQGQQTAQQTARNAELENKAPKLFEFDSTYLASVQAERDELRLKKILIDSMDISDSRREKLLSDLYRAKPTKRLTKALLAATISKEEDLTGDPEQKE